MEATQGKKSTVKTIIVIATSVALALAVVKGAEWGIKKMLVKKS